MILQFLKFYTFYSQLVMITCTYAYISWECIISDLDTDYIMLANLEIIFCNASFLLYDIFFTCFSRHNDMVKTSCQ